jgi:hypothetical protein
MQCLFYLILILTPNDFSTNSIHTSISKPMWLPKTVFYLPSLTRPCHTGRRLHRYLLPWSPCTTPPRVTTTKIFLPTPIITPAQMAIFCLVCLAGVGT